MNLKTLVKSLLVFSAVFLPFWFTFALFLFGTFYFEKFYFGIVIMFVVDLLYGFETFYFLDIPGVLFFGSVLVFFISMLIKQFININK